MSLLDASKASLWVSLASITFNPLFWNIAARREHRTRWLSGLCGGPRQGCYAIAAAIFSLGLVRDALFRAAMQEQPALAALDNRVVQAVAVAVMGAGMVLVVASTYMLGITGTFLGDYFGILMDARVTGFPFNVLDNPMYVGSTVSFLGAALWYARPAGLLVTAYVWLVYAVALRFEGPFTAMIYAARDAARDHPSQARKSAMKKKKL
ncbi:Phosphatidyl-N-methylethanolamine N-methyltransferase [Coemansia nantahalensis]|nr:Phosphatidyl-N-methylethanolamine N-methyltransferase [Coemansia nantahalensis]